MDLRRVPSIQDERQPPSIGDNLAIRHRQKLDSDWADVKNPYTSWRMKRNSIKNDLAKIKPDYTQDELNKIYASVGLGDSTNPGDFVREDSLYGTLSRAGSKSVNMFESLYDVVHMNYADWNDDMKTVMSVQEQMDDRNLETGLIDSWQKQTSYGQNALTQFLYDVASSAPLMVGVMGAGIAAGTVAGMAGAPVWLAGMLGMGAVDALTEAGFNFADIVSNPAVRKKIEASLGHEMVDADIDAIREETQRILMDEADTSAAQTAIVNFVNPLNWHPAVGKLSKLMKVGTGRLGSIKRVGAGTALREGGEEFGQSLLSQYTSKEAQLRAMSKSGVKEEDMPDVGVSGKEAAYEGLIGAFVGGGIGVFSGSRDFSRYKAGAINVDEGGYPVSKKPNEEGFIGAGPLRFETRRMVDEGNPKQLADWIDRLPRRDNPEGDAREADIIEDELNRIRQDEKLLGEKTSVEKQAQRKEYVDQYDEYRKDPELWERQQIPAEQLEAEQKLEEERNAEEEAQQQAIKDEGEEIFNEAQEAAEEVEKNAPISVKKGKTEVIVHPDLQHAVERILTVNANKRTKRQNEILQLAQENPALKYKEIADIIKKRESQDKFIFGDTNKQTTKGTGEKTTGAGTQNIAILEKVSQKIDEKDNRIQSLVDRIAMLESGEQTITPPAPTLVTPKETIQQQTSLNPDDLKLGPAADEIVNTLKSWVGQDKKAKSWDGLEGTEYSTWEEVRGKIYNPLKKSSVREEATIIQGGKNKGKERTEYFISPSIRLAKLNELATKLGIAPKQQEIIEDTIIEDTIVADSIEGDQPDQTTYEGSDVEVAPNYGNDGIEATPKYEYSELSQFINKEVMKETGKVASWSYIKPLTKMSVRHKGGEVMARLDTSLKENQRTQPTVLRFMGFNSKNEPYFNRVFERADRSGSTVRDRTNNPKEIIDPAAVSHLLSGLDKTFAGIKDTGKGDKKTKEAYASYQTVVPQEEVVQSDQAKSIIADQDRLATLSLEFDQLTDKVAKDRESVGADSKDIARLASIKGLIDLIHGRIEGSKLPDKEAPQIKVKEGGIPTQKEILNADGYAQELINKKQSNLRKLLKKNKDGLPKDEVIRTLDDIEELYGDGKIKMDYDFGVQLDKVKRDGKNVTLLRMRKTTPVSTFSLQYALKTFGWELVNKEMDGMVDNDIEVVVGQNIPVRKIKKYTDPIIVDGKNLTELAQRSRKFLNESLESAMKRRRGEGYVKTSLSEKEKAAYQRAADYELEKLDANKKEENAASFNWKVSARQFFLTKVAQKTPPTKTKTKTGLSTPQAIERVRNEMARINGVTQESINNTRDDEILEFLWSGPGGDTDIGSTPTITSTEMYDPNKKDHINYQVDNVVFKNGKSETIVGKWGKSGYNVIANEVVDSIGSRVDIEPPKAKPEPAPAQPTTEPRLDPDKPYTTAELAAIAKQQQRDMEKTLSKIEEVSTPEVVEPQVIEIHAGKITPEELRKALPKSDETKHKSARFNKLIKLPQYQDVTLWDSSLLPEQKAGKESLALTAQIKLDLGEDKPKGTGDLVKLIRRKLQGNLVHQLKIDEDVEELRQTIDDRYWDLLVGAGHTAINNQLTQRGSTPINRGVKSTGSKKKSKKDDVVKTPLVKEGFITSNIASATITNIPTENPKVNDVWLIAPEEANELFGQRSEGKDMEELTNFLDNNINNGDFFVVKKTGKWSDAYILLRDDFGAPVKGKGADKISVPATIKKRLSREGKFFNTEKPSDQRSKKLTGMEMKDLEGNVSSELFMQLFKTSPVDLNMLQDAYEDNRIVYAFNSGIDNQVEVYWRNEDGSTSTNDIDNAAIMLFNDNSMIGDFIDDIASKKPGNFRKADEHYRHLRDSERSTGDVVSEVFADAAVLSSGKGGIANTNDGLESAEIPLIGESLDTINQEVTEDIYGIAYDPEVATQVALDNEATASLSKEDLMARRLKDLARQKDTSKRLAEDPPEGAEPVSFKVISDIVDRFREAFPGLADVTIIKDQTPGFKAIYDKKFDRIYLVNKQHFSEEDVIKSLWHEGIGHGGLQAIMTEEEYLNLKQRAEVSFPERFQEELELINKDKDFNTKSDEEKRSLAAQEVLAHYADNLDGQSESIIDTITSWIREIYNGFATVLGFNELTLTEGDMRSLLLETADALRYHNKERRLKVLPKVDSMSDLPEQVDTSLQRRTVLPNPTSFNNANLPESARESWDKLYTRETNETTGSWWKDIRQRLVTRVFDPYSIIKDEIGTTEYMNTRLAGRSDGMLATILNYSGIKVAKRSIGNVVINETLVDPKIKGLFSTLKPLGTPTERQQFFGWITFNRADKLYKEGKESGFTRQQIDEGLQYNKGRIKNASTGVVVSREQLYEDIRKKVMQMNSSIVKIGIDMGLFNKEVSNNFESEFYVPFYRLIEEEIGDNNRGGFTGNYSGLTGQQGVKKLKGSNRPIGDPFNNLLFNWLHIMDASIKNDAANTTINSALSIRNPMDSSQMLVEPTNTNSSNTIRVKQNGVEKKYNINNQLLYNSMTALSSETKFPGLKYAIGAKGLFTKIITSFPGFKATNYFKDTITAAGTSDIGFNLVGNAIGGFRSIKDLHADMLVSGGYIQFAYTRSDDPKYAETLLNKELKSGYILNNPESDNTFLSALKKANHMRRGLLDKYAKFGDKLENANRAALFKNLIAEGKSQTEAAFEARDLMDFTLHGGADWVKLVTSLTPFANAILQGKYKLARQIKNNPKPVAAVSGLVLMASLFEQMYYENDEEYQARPDWDKDTYWWIPLPGTDTNFKLPKPHEFSIIGNMAWRALKMSKEENPEYGEALMSGVKSIVSREFGIVPLPQIMKPFIEVGMNRNLFFDRDIEPMGSRGLSPSKRYGQFTSETAILASEILEKMPLDKLKLSPYQLQHLIEGYFGWIGSYTLATADMITRNAGNFPERPARKLMDYQLARRFFKSSPLRNTKYGTIFYERLKDIEQTVQDMELARKLGHMDEYLEIYEEKKDILMYKNFIKKKTRMINDLNARIKEIRYSIDMGGEEKSVRMDRLYQLRNQLMRHVVETAKLR